MYKIKAYNEHREFFLKNMNSDILYKQERQAIEFCLSLAGLYDALYDLKLKEEYFPDDLKKDLE